VKTPTYTLSVNDGDAGEYCELTQDKVLSVIRGMFEEDAKLSPEEKAEAGPLCLTITENREVSEEVA
jgi:hypothetical protein